MSEQAYYHDRVCATRMGDYRTEVEKAFINNSLSANRWVRTILDVGGGSGRFAIPLRQSGYTVVVTEVSEVALRSLRRGGEDVPCILAGHRVEDLPIADGSVDCILCIEVFPILKDMQRFFSGCHRVLGKNGLLIFTAQNVLSYKGLAKKLILRENQSSVEWKKEHYTWSINDVRASLRDAGFTILQEKGLNWAPVTNASNSKLVSLSARFERLLSLDKLVSISPWALVSAKKSE